ncbi:transcription factor bHLH51 [Ziziphus jujuba]|uniref:Transcription factor bHLH51 n=2 Tax=Ziziphus jujuba TaxID=326968 RepID=A0A6P3YTP5_ZIZJJ|nr:transcription factor bHLH51 [Ziziphus jujuba]
MWDKKQRELELRYLQIQCFVFNFSLVFCFFFPQERSNNMENVYHPNWSEPANSSRYKSATISSSTTATSTESSFLLPWSLSPHASTSSTFQFSGFPSTTSSGSIPFERIAEDRAAAASKSHSQAEKRRRDRINAQLSTLRKLIPKSDKMDKAALLGSVIDQVKDLKRKAMEVSKAIIVPTEVDEVAIESSTDELSEGQDVNLSVSKSNNSNNNNTYIRVSVCCEDRPELFSELIQVLKGLKLSAVRAEVASVGGRIKSVLVLSSNKDTDDKEAICINSLKQSLKLVLTKIASSSVPSNCRIRSKRQRFFLPSHFS